MDHMSWVIMPGDDAQEQSMGYIAGAVPSANEDTVCDGFQHSASRDNTASAAAGIALIG